MPKERLSMRETQFRPKRDRGLSNRRVAHGCGVARGAVRTTCAGRRRRDVTWPLPKDPDDAPPGTGGNQRASVGAGSGRDAS